MITFLVKRLAQMCLTIFIFFTITFFFIQAQPGGINTQEGAPSLGGALLGINDAG